MFTQSGNLNKIPNTFILRILIQRLIIEKLGMCALSMEEVHGIGVKEAVKYALSRIDPRNKRQVHVSFDIDALDPLEAPSTGTPGNIP